MPPVGFEPTISAGERPHCAVIVFLGLGILWIVWFKPATKCNPCMWKCIVKPKPRPKTTTEQTLNQCNIGLQVKPDGSEKQTTEKEQGTSSGEIPKRSASPTVFSRPGVIVADHL